MSEGINSDASSTPEDDPELSHTEWFPFQNWGSSASVSEEQSSRRLQISPINSRQAPPRENLAARNINNRKRSQLDFTIHFFHGEEDETELCVICQENYCEWNLMGQLHQCGHKYHLLCLTRWMEERPTCPICRSRTNNS